MIELLTPCIGRADGCALMQIRHFISQYLEKHLHDSETHVNYRLFESHWRLYTEEIDKNPLWDI